MARVIAGLIALLILISGTTYYLYQKNVSFYVAFNDGKNLTVGDSVYLSGLPVGKVVKILPNKGKISFGVHIDKKYRDQFFSNSSFFIGPDITARSHMSLLVRNSNSYGGSQLKPEDKVEGINSYLVWSGLEVADRVHEMVRSETWQDLLRETGSVAQDFKKSIKQIDVGRLGVELRSDIEALSMNIDIALQGNESRRGLYELQNQIEHVQQRLKRLGDSEESHQLQEALNNFQNRLKEKIPREGK